MCKKNLRDPFHFFFKTMKSSSSVILIITLLAECHKSHAFFNDDYQISSSTFTRPIDMSYAIDDISTVYWDSSKKVYIQRHEISQDDSTYKSYNKVCFPEHSGTHLVASAHLNKDGFKVADIPFNHLIATGNCVSHRGIK